MSILPFRGKGDMAIVGWACRMPGARSVDELWSLLRDARCAITGVPADRFPLDRFGHPRRGERGRSYSWSAGIVDGIWGFDPSVFGISPREVVQMDPQQRIVLQLSWEALEDAGIPPRSIAGSNVGVYVGACQVEYAHRYAMDPAVADAHFATGTSLAVVANRISHAFDLRGPSMTIDTACSSSLVALHEAVEALRSGRIDTAIVGGVNVIASPGSFIAFSQASMLSPTGLCRSFSAAADGFVRAEGGGVLILQHAGRVDVSKRPVHGYVVATEVNSDGHTGGISLPSQEGQRSLLERIYARADIDPKQLAFIECHGTGTPVGDPIEAAALGRALGEARDRSAPLLIGSIKTNIGHLEPAAGMAGLIKCLLALNRQLLPASLHFGAPNPNIAFDELNLAVCDELTPLPLARHQVAGVSSFGFGGTNAHAIVAPGRGAAPPGETPTNRRSIFMISAASPPALAHLARSHAERVAGLSKEGVAAVASAAVHRRERLARRAVVTSVDAETVARALTAQAVGLPDAQLVAGEALGDELPVAFVYSGNGTQWVGMGRSGFAAGPVFSAHFDKLDRVFEPLAGWSLRDMLFSDRLADELTFTKVAQPLLFAIQSAATAELRSRGFAPALVLGHSVGEIAAAEAAGIIDAEAAMQLAFLRSKCQEQTRGLGRMAAVRASPEGIADMLAAVPGLQAAAFNSPRSVTVAGSPECLATLADRFPRVPMVDLDLEYPFHTSLMDRIRPAMARALSRFAGRASAIPFLSTVAGEMLAGSDVDGGYWWRNVREPVQFTAAVQSAHALGARLFIEIGPRPSLAQHIVECLDAREPGVTTHALFDRGEIADPFAGAVAKALVCGAHIAMSASFGEDPGPTISLPPYPWQQTEYRLQPTSEAVGGNLTARPLLGLRYFDESVEWHSNIDTVLYPRLKDHQVGGQTLFPGTGFIEIALSAVREWLRVDDPVVSDCEIIRPLNLSKDQTVDVLTRISPASRSLEISSRPRLSNVPWTVHARCRFSHGHGEPAPPPAVSEDGHVLDRAALYDIAAKSDLNYGSSFQLVDRTTVHEGGVICVDLAAGADESDFTLDPIRLDCCSHGLVSLFPELEALQRNVTYIPVRVDHIALYHPQSTPTRAIIEVLSKTSHAIVANYHILDSAGRMIARLQSVRGQAVTIRVRPTLETAAFVDHLELVEAAIKGVTGIPVEPDIVLKRAGAVGLLAGRACASDPATLAFEEWARAVGVEIAGALARDGLVDPDRLIAEGRMRPEHRPWLGQLMSQIARAGVATARPGGWALCRDRKWVRSEHLLQAMGEQWLERTGDLSLAGWLSGVAARIAAEGRVSPNLETAPPISAIDLHEGTNAFATSTSRSLLRLVDDCRPLWPQNRKLRILLVGHGPLTRPLGTSSSQRKISLTVFEPSRRSFDRASALLASGCIFRLLGEDGVGELGTYDLVMSAGGLSRLPSTWGIKQLEQAMAPEGLFLAAEPGATLFRQLVAGTAHDGCAVRDARQWERALQSVGFESIRTATLQESPDNGVLIVAKRGAARGPVAIENPQPAGQVFVIAGEPSDLALAVTAELERGASPGLRYVGSGAADRVTPGTDAVFIGRIETTRGAGEVLLRRCQELKACVTALSSNKAKVWLVFSGAMPSSGGQPVCPTESAAWVFSRVLANEFPAVDIRRIDVTPGTPPAEAARQIRIVLESGTDETDLHGDGRYLGALRIARLESMVDDRRWSRQMASRLELRSTVAQRMTWRAVERLAPGRGEVEIAVEATGVNFRDLMGVLSLLPQEMLEDGIGGPALGFECAGRISRIGPSVKGLRVGDRVAALAANAFSSHVTVKAAQVSRLPDFVNCDAAATIPVAFLTAYHSIVRLAKLKKGETILIHGGAGAVGMAAIQIAKWRGARIIATAGSTAKRGLLRALGVSHVLDSRTMGFLEEVRAITGKGADVVLNSLAGEAMEASISCVRPFGRFVELGKRDYAANTAIGLRPFRHNVSYFAVDLDQLVARPGGARSIFKNVMALFHRGVLKPLPFTRFAGEEVGEAFRLMQQSHHVGKIVVLPALAAKPPALDLTAPVDARGTHVVTGAFGGFGMEIARWLVDLGVRNLALFGRTGAASPEAQKLVAELAGQGVAIFADPVDVSDFTAVNTAFEKLTRTMPPVVGVMHAAMVLADAIAANLDDDRFRRVCAPKVTGADNLDAATRGLKLDYFVLFSSITTVLGHPGQGNYVAANGYLEGLAYKRRAEGLPALAVRWAPISDVGAAATNDKARRRLSRLAARGAGGAPDAIESMALRARDALGLLGQVLARGPEFGTVAVVTLCPLGGRFRRDLLALLRSPTYQPFVTSERDEPDEIFDIAALLQAEDLPVVRGKIVRFIVGQIAKVLHTWPEDVNLTRPLAEAGLDSLMALEFAFELEKLAGITIALSQSMGALTPVSLADEIIRQVRVGSESAEEAVAVPALPVVSEPESSVEIAA